jgi:hypothetical protein
LQQFIGVFKNVAKFVSSRAQRFRRQLRRHFNSRHGAVFRNKPYFVDLDAGVSGQRRLQLFSELVGLGVAARKRAHEPRKLRLCQIFREVNAGDSRRGQQLRETSFARRRSQRHSVQQDLVSRSSQQHACFAAFQQRRVQFLPRSFELRGRAHVSELVQTCEFQQNVQTANKRPRR